jgi:hypothetical protein
MLDTVAVTLYVPATVSAVNRDDVAMPNVSVVDESVIPPGNTPEGPDAGAVK